MSTYRARGGRLWDHPEGQFAFEHADPGPSVAAHDLKRRRLWQAFSTQRQAAAVLKRGIDLLVAITSIVTLGPLILFIALSLTIHLGGNPFFLHERIGLGGVRFQCIKFRTMRASDLEECEEPEALYRFKSGIDTRTTRFTRFLRRCSLDELPQLVNVAAGHMSLVGPRPVVPQELDTYFGRFAPIVLMVKPGMTGLWTVNGRSNVGYPERALMELRYATTASPWLDTQILLKTIAAVVTRRGAV